MYKRQVYNNWSPYLVKKKNELWLGLEFFCKEGDDFWNLSEDECAKIQRSKGIIVVLVRIKEIRELQKTDSGLLQLFLCIVPASPEKTIAKDVYKRQPSGAHLP